MVQSPDVLVLLVAKAHEKTTFLVAFCPWGSRKKLTHTSDSIGRTNVCEQESEPENEDEIAMEET